MLGLTHTLSLDTLKTLGLLYVEALIWENGIEMRGGGKVGLGVLWRRTTTEEDEEEYLKWGLMNFHQSTFRCYNVSWWRWSHTTLHFVSRLEKAQNQDVPWESKTFWLELRGSQEGKISNREEVRGNIIISRKIISHYLGLPRNAAWWIALKPLLLVIIISAWWSSSRESISSRFLEMASWSGVSPSESYNSNENLRKNSG